MSKRNLRGLIALLIVFVLTAGVCCLGFVSRNNAGKWFGNIKNPSTWHWSDKSSAENNDFSDGNDNSGVGGSILTNGDEENGIQISTRKFARSEYTVNGIS